MKRFPLFLATLASLTLTTSCANHNKMSKENGDCASNSSRISKDFETGRFSNCQRLADNSYQLDLVPEDKPINASPWYAFRIDADKGETVSVTLNYTHHKHRYKPKMSKDLQNWQLLDEGNIKLTEDKKQATLTVTMPESRVWIAAQPILNNNFYKQWLSGFKKQTDSISVSSIGESTEGRPLYQLASMATKNDAPALILLGRQHPPEVTGAMAMKVFVDRLFADDQLAEQFRQKFNLYIYPNINPDGVAAGNWRHNNRGKDLNRDWGPFSQQETRTVMNAVEKGIKGKAVWSMLDFHSTWDDIFYIQNRRMPNRFPEFTQDWLNDINNTDMVIDFTPKPGHNATSPTSKTYFYERFNMPAITFELGDNSTPEDIDVAAKVAAETYMQQLLKRVGE
jgi:predicted deacylase